MANHSNVLNSLNELKTNKNCFFYSLPALSKQLGVDLKKLPITIRIMLESLVRNCDGFKVKEQDIVNLANWKPKTGADGEVPFMVSRVLLQDFTGVPLLVDLAAMRDAVKKQGKDPSSIEPIVPVDLVIDHSVQVDKAGTRDAFLINLALEFERNEERYSFLKWGQQAFKTFSVVPSGIGICHQVNLELLASVVTGRQHDGKTLLYFDTLVGTDSHTTMINGLGVLGWGVGGIEAEAAMLGQPLFLPKPEIIGVLLTGKLQPGVTATDLTLYITELLRKEKVVGKFIEYFGEGAASLTVADRATIGNMAPEYGANTGFFPPDEHTLDYLRMTGRPEESITKVKDYLIAQDMFGIPKENEVEYSKVIKLDLNTVKSCVSGPKRPQDRIDLPNLKTKFDDLLAASIQDGGYAKPKNNFPKVCVHAAGSFSINAIHDSGGTPELGDERKVQSWGEAEMVTNRPITNVVTNPGYVTPSPQNDKSCDILLTHGSIVIAAITSCTNTSNPNVMIAAGLLAKKAVEKGLLVNDKVKTSLAPGSRVVTDYLEKTGLQKYLDKLGFQLVAYGCTTCIGNSGPLDEHIENAIKEHDLIAASVLSGNRNFEARIHSAVKANFLMSPPLVVAFALAGRVDIDLTKDPLGRDSKGAAVYLKDIWPSDEEINNTLQSSLTPDMFKTRYAHVESDNPVWSEISTRQGAQYDWDEESTYIRNPPYFENFTPTPSIVAELKNMRALALFGDSVTTDHISPAGAFKADSPAGQYLLSLGIQEQDFNSYGSRRGNHEIMVRGTFANVRIRNKMADGKEGGFTKFQPEGKLMSIFDASQEYAKRKVPLIVFAGKDYGMGSSRDWAAKGPALLGVKVVVARSFERIHRSNLVGMGILPLQFMDDETDENLGITGDETFSVEGIEKGPKLLQELTLVIQKNGQNKKVKVIARIDTPVEIEYYKHGGILPYVLRQQLK